MQLTTMSCEFPAVRRGAGRPSWTATASVRKSAAVWCASSSRPGDNAEFGCGSDGLVDEGMVVLRRRIHEMKAAEASWEPPAEWAAWEKEWYGSYDADVCELVGLLQAFLMSSRPGVGVGVVAVLMLSVPTSVLLLLSHLLHASRALLSHLHH